MLNPSRVLLSRQVRQTLKIFRSTGSFGLGGWVEGVPTEISIQGAAWPSTNKEIQQVPEGDRVQGMISFACKQELYVTRIGETPGTSDQIEWRGDRYKILQLLNFNDYGFNVAVGVRLQGA